jgi:hypothetical protein
MKELKDLREELCIIVPFFIFSLILFFGSFQYKFESRTVPMLIGALAILLSGMRLFHIIFPKSKIGKFGEAGLAGEFDSMKEEIEEEVLKEHYEEPSKPITFLEEKKAFIALLGGSLALFIFGYFVGGFFLIVGTSFYYGYKEKLPLLVSLVTMFIIVYILLIKVLDSPMYHGVLLEPILNFFNLI